MSENDAIIILELTKIRCEIKWVILLFGKSEINDVWFI